MRFLKIICFTAAISLAWWGCSDSPSSGGGGNGGGDNGGGDGGGNETTEYSLSASASPSEGGMVEPTDSTYDEGTEVTVEAIAEEGWVFESWSGDQESEDNPLSFSISEDTELTANFSDTTADESVRYNFSAESSPMAGGTVEPSDSVYDEGAEVTVEAMPNDGWVFDGWRGDRESSENPMTFEITEDTQLVAQFKDTTSDEPTQYSLAVSTDPSAGGSVSPSEGTYDEGTEVTVEARTNSGYAFTGWTGDTTSSDNPLTLNMTEDTKLTANFEEEQADKYNLSTTVKPAEAGAVDPPGGSYEKGSQVTVEAIPNTHWKFFEWSGDAGQSVDNPLSFTISADMSITANFKKVNYDLTVSTNPSSGGSVDPFSGSYEAETQVTVEATPNDGYIFAGWSGDTTSSENPLTLTMIEDTELTANFEQDQAKKYQLSTNATPAEGGSIDPSEGTFEEGSEVTVEAISNEHWKFKNWSGDLGHSTENPLSFTINSDTKLAANFTKLEYDFSVSTDPGVGGTVEPSGGSYEAETSVTVEAVANDGWNFTGWTGDTTSSDNPLTFSITDDTELTANFEEKTIKYSLSATAKPSEAGSIEPSSGTFEQGEKVTVEATANDGWKFAEWVGDQQSTDNPLSFNIYGDTELTAKFTELYDLTVSKAPSEGGTVDPKSGTYEAGTEVSVEATPNDHWNFSGWTGDTSATSSVLVFDISENTNLTANFSKEKVSLNIGAQPQHGGSVTPATGEYEYGTEITAEASPNDGWRFIGWSGDITSDQNPVTFTLDGYTRVDANFEEIQYESIYTVDVSATNGDETINLSFGQKEGATRGFESEFDQYAPPEPPSGVFYVSLSNSAISEDLYKDFRSNTSDEEQWNLGYQMKSGSQVELSWSVNDNAEIPGSLILTDQNNSFEIDMTSQSSYTISGSQSGELVIKYTYDHP